MGQKSLTQFKNLSVLIVEDYDFNREILFEMLDMMGIQADESENGEEAMVKVKNQNYDLIIMDIRMPLKDGYQTTIEIRSLPIKQPIIIGLTASSLLQDLGKCKECGMEDYLTKPLEVEQLESTLKDYFPDRIAEGST